VNGTPPKNVVDIVAAYNAANDPDLATSVGWVPTFVEGLTPAKSVPADVQSSAGPFTHACGHLD
jgi:pectate lyase